MLKVAGSGFRKQPTVMSCAVKAPQSRPPRPSTRAGGLEGRKGQTQTPFRPLASYEHPGLQTTLQAGDEEKRESTYKCTYCTSFPRDGGLLSTGCCHHYLAPLMLQNEPGQWPSHPRVFLESIGPIPLRDLCGVRSISMQVVLSLLLGTSERIPGPAAFPGKPGRRPCPWL